MADIVVYNRSAHAHDDTLVPGVAAINWHIATNLVPFWGTEVAGTVHMETGPPTSWQFVLQDTIDIATDLAYHVDANGNPSAIIDVAACLQYGTSWVVALCHEVLETLIDPTASRTCNFQGTTTMVEVVDPVEMDVFDHIVDAGNTVALPNFVTPAWFGFNQNTRYDFMGRLTSPCPAMSASGYMMSQVNGQWQSQFAPAAKLNPPFMAIRHGGRRSWRVSHP